MDPCARARADHNAKDTREQMVDHAETFLLVVAIRFPFTSRDVLCAAGIELRASRRRRATVKTNRLLSLAFAKCARDFAKTVREAKHRGRNRSREHATCALDASIRDGRNAAAPRNELCG